MDVRLLNLGFEPAYEVDIDPDFPSTGVWNVRRLRIGDHAEGRILFRLTPEQGNPWIGDFGCDTRSVHAGLYACPNANHLLVCTGLRAYLIDVSDPDSVGELPIAPITDVSRPAGIAMLVVTSFQDIAGIDTSGLIWIDNGLFLDDLKVAASDAGVILVRGTGRTTPGVESRLKLDALTGNVIDSDESR